MMTTMTAATCQMQPLACDPAKLAGPSKNMDFGAKTAAYVDAFIQNIAWNKVVNRFTARH